MDDRIKQSRKQEQRVAKRTSGKVQPGSGSGWRRRQDVRTEKVLFEMKRTGKTQITVKASDLEQLRKHAVLDDRMMAMHIEVGGRSYVLIEEGDFLEWYDRE